MVHNFEKESDKGKFLKLMRAFSSCYRYAYKRLLGGMERKGLKKHFQEVFPGDLSPRCGFVQFG